MFPKPGTFHTVVFDFDGVFTNNKVIVDQNGSESVVCDRADGLAFDFIRSYQKRGLLSAEFFILSKEPNPVVLTRAKKMRLKCYHGISDKKKFLSDYIGERFPEAESALSGLIYVGNDLNDLPAMRIAGTSVAPSDSHPLVQQQATIVMPQKGGDGFVRAFVEGVLGIDKLGEEDLDELISNC